jgi:cupin fold WbuC family metalloprotein
MKVFSNQYFEDLLSAATQSERLRAHANIHHSYDDPCQKLFNAINTDSYIRPHRHSLDPKEEFLIAVRGLFGLVVFKDSGLVDSATLFGSEKYSEELSIASGVELSAGVWHTVVTLVDQAVLFEVKSGPFNPGLAKEFPIWAPEEASEDAPQYLEALKRQCLSALLKMRIED